MAEFEENEFESAGSDAALAVPQQGSSVRKNGYILIKNRPCKVVEMSTSKTGKHGGCKIHMTALDIFTSKKYDEIFGSTATVLVPNVTRREYQLLNISDENFLELMSENGDIKEDIRLPDDKLGEEIRRRFDNDEQLLIQVLASMNEEGVAGVRAASDK